ncbi:MAG: aminotransferase class V-fold PLP-dependent enzyme [bacterium]|nr:aminotransferase class V-fold PLP-dependent enzyme [bacterium]
MSQAGPEASSNPLASLTLGELKDMITNRHWRKIYQPLLQNSRQFQAALQLVVGIRNSIAHFLDIDDESIGLLRQFNDIVLGLAEATDTCEPSLLAFAREALRGAGKKTRSLNNAAHATPSLEVAKAVHDHLLASDPETAAILGLPGALASALSLRESFAFRMNATQALRDSVESILFHNLDPVSHQSRPGEEGADLARMLLTRGVRSGPPVGRLVMSDVDHPAVVEVLRTVWPRRSLEAIVRISDLVLANEGEKASTQILDRYMQILASGGVSVLVIPHVVWFNGAVLDVVQICRTVKERWPLIATVVDGAQAVGHIPLGVEECASENLDIDFYVGCGHKWLGGPETLGFVRVGARIHGGCSRCSAFLMAGDQVTDSSGLVFAYQGSQIGTQQRGVARGMYIALQRLGRDSVVLAKRAHEIRALGARLREGLSSIPRVSFAGPPSELRSGIVAFEPLGESERSTLRVQHALATHGYATARYKLPQATGRVGSVRWILRMSPSAFFPHEEISFVVDLVRDALNNG